MDKPPRKGTANKEPDKLADILPSEPIGYAPESQGTLVPYHYIAPLIEAKVGQMKAEVERDFSQQLAKIDNLPTKWQLIAGGMSAIVIALTLLFGIMSYFGDRQDSAVERSATVTQSLTRIEGKLDQQMPTEAQPNGK